MDFTGFDFSDDEFTKSQKKAKRKRGKRNKKGELDEEQEKEAKKNFKQEMDEIEKLDYEVDYVGDEELKFKYRETEANDYGLTAEELLNATDAELNQWVGLREVTKFDTPGVFSKKRKFWRRDDKTHEAKKKQIFKSIYGTEEEKERIAENDANKRAKKMNSKRRRKKREAMERLLLEQKGESKAEEEEEVAKVEMPQKEEKKKRKRKKKNPVVATDRLEQYFGAEAKNVEKKMKYGDTSLKHEV